MSKVGKALAVSFGALAGGAAGFYVLEMYKIKSKVSWQKIKVWLALSRMMSRALIRHLL